MSSHLDHDLQESDRQGPRPRAISPTKKSAAICPTKRRHRPHRRPCSPRSTAWASSSSTAPTPTAAIWPRNRPPSHDGDRAFVLNDGMPQGSSDPIRMYLSQMAEIPLLTRDEEIRLAKKIEVTRKRFRRTVLRLVLRHAGHGRDAAKRPQRRAAVRSHDQGLAHRAADQGADAGPHAAQPAAAASTCCRPSRRDFTLLISRKRHAAKTRPRPASAFLRRRDKMLTLVEELSLRTRRVQPLMRQLEEMSQRMDELQRATGRAAQSAGSGRDDRHPSATSCAT